MLWQGKSPQRLGSRRQYLTDLGALVLGIGLTALLMALLGKLDQLPYYAVGLTAFLALSLVPRVLLTRNQLMTGDYTITDRRILVEDRVWGIPVRRDELLSELKTPELLDGSVAFGDPKSGAVAGTRQDGVVIPPLVLWHVPEPERVLEIVRRAQQG